MGWQVTSTTIHCDRVDDFVVLMAHEDGKVRCAWHDKHACLNYLTNGSRRYRLERPFAVYLLWLEQLRLRIEGYILQPSWTRRSRLLQWMWVPIEGIYKVWRAFYKIQYFMFEGMINREIVRRKWRVCKGLGCPNVDEFRERALSM